MRRQIFCQFSPGEIGFNFVTENFTTFFNARKEMCHLELAPGASSPKILSFFYVQISLTPFAVHRLRVLWETESDPTHQKSFVLALFEEHLREPLLVTSMLSFVYFSFGPAKTYILRGTPWTYAI